MEEIGRKYGKNWAKIADAPKRDLWVTSECRSVGSRQIGKGRVLKEKGR
jgi:hypothetical protein